MGWYATVPVGAHRVCLLVPASRSHLPLSTAPQKRATSSFPTCLRAPCWRGGANVTVGNGVRALQEYACPFAASRHRCIIVRPAAPLLLPNAAPSRFCPSAPSAAARTWAASRTPATSCTGRQRWVDGRREGRRLGFGPPLTLSPPSLLSPSAGRHRAQGAPAGPVQRGAAHAGRGARAGGCGEGTGVGVGRGWSEKRGY